MVSDKQVVVAPVVVYARNEFVKDGVGPHELPILFSSSQSATSPAKGYRYEEERRIEMERMLRPQK